MVDPRREPEWSTSKGSRRQTGPENPHLSIPGLRPCPLRIGVLSYLQPGRVSLQPGKGMECLLLRRKPVISR